jgi:hypothetical protein
MSVFVDFVQNLGIDTYPKNVWSKRSVTESIPDIDFTNHYFDQITQSCIFMTKLSAIFDQMWRQKYFFAYKLRPKWINQIDFSWTNTRTTTSCTPSSSWASASSGRWRASSSTWGTSKWGRPSLMNSAATFNPGPEAGSWKKEFRRSSEFKCSVTEARLFSYRQLAQPS